MCLGTFFPLYFRFVYLNEEQEWMLIGKKGWTVLVILHSLHLLLPFWIHSSPWCLPQNSITWYLLPLASSWFPPIGGHYQEKRVRGQSYQVPISTTLQFHLSQPMLWQWPCSSVCVHHCWAAHHPPLQLLLSSDTTTLYPHPIRLCSSNGLPFLWAPECFTIPFCISYFWLHLHN